MNIDFKNIIDEELKNLTISDKLKTKILQQTKYKKSNHEKPIIIAIVLAISLTLVIGVSAQNSLFKNLIDKIGTEKSQKLQQINKSIQDKGIKMDIIGAMNDNEIAVIYFTLQDLTGNRLSNKSQIETYSIDKGFVTNCQMVDYDEQTKIATFCIRSNGDFKANDLNKTQLTLVINSILKNGYTEKYEDIKIDIDILDILNKNLNIQTVKLDKYSSSGGGGDLYSQVDTILKPNVMNIPIPEIDFVHITNIGIIDNRLHIQTKWDRKSIDEHGRLYFDEFKEPETNIYFGVNEESQPVFGDNYIEFIYDFDVSKFSNLNLKGYFVRTLEEELIEGNWKVNFEFEPVEQKNLDCNIELENYTIKNILISPITVKLKILPQTSQNTDNINMILNYNDGQTIKMKNTFNLVKDKTIKTFETNKIIDIDKLKSIIIDNKQINIR